MKVWIGLGDKAYVLFYFAVHPPTPGQLDFQVVDNLSMNSLEG